MWIELPDFWIFVVNCVGIPAAHLLTAWCSNVLPRSFFKPDSFLYRTRQWEVTTGIYERWFHIRRWKHLLPDAAPWFSGFAKAGLKSTDSTYLKQFVAETCRGEFSHWIQILVIGSFIIWTPSPASWIIVGYSLLSNMPCILNLRHTRVRLRKVLTSTRR